MRNLGRIYEAARTRVIDVATTVPTADEWRAIRVPACPGWSVHDVLAHLTGVCADILDGNVAGAATDEWTSAQVEARRELPIDGILNEWRVVGPAVAATLDDFPGRYGPQVVADVATHEHDVRGALGAPGARDSEAVGVALDFLIEVIAHPYIVARGLGPLEIRADDRAWTVGTGVAPAGEATAWTGVLLADDPLPAPIAEAVGHVVVEPFELFRALTGRRSAPQIRSYGWTIDPGPYLPMFGAGPFETRGSDLVE